MPTPPLRIRLVHWNRAEATERAGRLQALGYEVSCDLPDGPTFLRAVRESPPSAVVIDLGRLPSQGRDIALALRAQKATRNVPLLFVGGEAAKVARVRELLADATYTSWDEIAATLPRTIAAPPAHPLVPASSLAGYSGTPLPKKLGVKPGTRVALVEAPEDFAATLGELPAGATVGGRPDGGTTLTIWFVRSLRDIEDGMTGRTAALVTGSLWIAWPKKTSALASDLGEREVRAAGLAAGLVDYKVCAIDATWSGLLFTRRRQASRLTGPPPLNGLGQ